MVGRVEKPKGKDKGIPGEAQDLLQLVVAYAKQETIDPARNLLNFVKFGFAGALLGSMGAVLLLLGLLRLLQSETGSTFDGKLTFVPYLIVLFVSALIVVGAMKGRQHGQRRAPA